MKPRFFIIIFSIILILIISAAAASSGGGKKTTGKAGIGVFTVNGDIGIAQIVVNNRNVYHGIITLTPVDLPFSFNFTKGDTIVLNASTLEGYSWNAWRLNNGTFNNADSYIFTTTDKDDSLVLTAACLPKGG